MQINSNHPQSFVDFSANLFQEKRIVPEQIVSHILEDLDLQTLVTLNKVNKSWNHQVCHFPFMKFLNSFFNFPQLIGFKSYPNSNHATCRPIPSLDNFQVEEGKRVSLYDILANHFQIDILDDEAIEQSSNNPRLCERVKKLSNDLNYHVFLFAKCTIQRDYTIQLEEIDHQIDGTICCLTNSRTKDVKIVSNAEATPQIVFKLIFDDVTLYDLKIGQPALRLMLRLKKIEVISGKNEEHLSQAVKIFNQICQSRNELEDERFFESFCEELVREDFPIIS